MRLHHLKRLPAWKHLPICTALAAVMLVSLGASQAAAGAEPAPAWSIQTVAQPTSFSTERNAICQTRSERCNRYTLIPTNVGARASSGLITVTDTLPAGLTTAHTPGGESLFMRWECQTEAVAGHEVVTCTSEGSVPALTAAAQIAIYVEVDPSASGTLQNRVEVSGGGAASTATGETGTPIGAPPAPFGLLTFEASLLDPVGAPITQAASHPSGFTTSFAFPSANSAHSPAQSVESWPVEEVKQIVTDLPAGVIGDALAAPTCSLADITNLTEEQTQCPLDSRVGKLALLEPGGAETGLTIFNVTPERGHPAEFAVFLPSLQRAEVLYASVVGSGPDTHVRVTSAPQNAVATNVAVSLTFFGDPTALNESPLSPVAMFTAPSDCQTSGFTTSMHVDSWQHPGRFLADGEPDFSDPNWKGATSPMPPVTGCERLHFNPSITVTPDTTQADSPTGLNVDLAVPQNEDPNGLATPPLKDTTVTLPEGMAVSPGAADGLVGCTDAQLGVGSTLPAACPPASQIATVSAKTPILGEALTGQVFVGAPECGPCSAADAQAGRLLRLFLQVQVPGSSLKFPGTVSVDPATGRLTSTFAGLAQQPVSDIQLHFKGGPRAPLATPQTCGKAQTTSDLVPWSAPFTADGTPSSSFDVDWDGTGGACPSALPFSPGFSAGTVTPLAGAFSPFTLTFSRHDREQSLSKVTVAMPPGLLGRIAGIPLCGEPQAAQGACSEASRIGTVKAAAGAGSHPFWTEGKVYLTGAYGGGPFGLSIVVPAVAGPFNLGSVVVRSSIHVDPHSAALTVASDPLPQMLDGVPLRLQTVNVTIDRPGFTFNPTNCAQMQVAAVLTAAQGASAGVSSPFAAGGCVGLPFKPSFKVSTQAKTSKKNGASLDVKVGSGAGQANIGKVAVSLPRQLPSRLTTIQQACPEATFAANPASCPAGSDIGTASASTPVLSNPVVGPAYLVSHGGAAFPDLVIILQGEGIMLELVGSIDIKKGVTSSTFASIPDAPISTFELNLPQGPHSALAAVLPAKKKGDLCGTSLVMPTTITGQNGAQVKQSTKIAVTGCPKAKKKKAHKPKKRKRKR